MHRAKLVSAWVGRHAARIELHFLPGWRHGNLHDCDHCTVGAQLQYRLRR